MKCKHKPCVLEQLLKIFGTDPCYDCKRMGLDKRPVEKKKKGEK